MPKKVDLSVETLLDLAERNLTQAEMSEITGVSIPTLTKRLNDLQEKQGLLLKAIPLRQPSRASIWMLPASAGMSTAAR